MLVDETPGAHEVTDGPYSALGIAGSSSMQQGRVRTWWAEAPEGTPYDLVRAGLANALLPKSPTR